MSHMLGRWKDDWILMQASRNNLTAKTVQAKDRSIESYYTFYSLSSNSNRNEDMFSLFSLLQPAYEHDIFIYIAVV